jgi:phage shock protein PspC (stress-responsive transcriptional regulator)
MNEVTRVHLGRQPYTISVEAHNDLKDYLADIEQKVGDKEVVQEVELRMSELLGERGVTGDKVILPSDVECLREQLGDPADFSDEPETSAAVKDENKGDKRLFRDTDNAMVAGVASGLASYFGLDVVIIRLVFVLLAIAGSGVGIFLYFVLWVLVPAAETTSEKLQMRGKPVTLEALKESVNRADVPAAARRINSRVLPIINSLFALIIKIIGVGFVLTAIGIIIGVVVTETYMLLHGGQLFQENLFPVGVREHVLVTLGLVLAAIVAIFFALIGVATFKRKWPTRGWITAVLIGLFLFGSAAAGALAADAVPRIHQRYESSLHTTAVKGIQPFDKVVTTGDIDIAYISSPDYAVNLHYSYSPDLSKIKIHTANNTLYIDSTAIDSVNPCTMLCLFPRYNMTVQVYAPNVGKFVTPPNTEIFYPAPPSLN